MRLLAQFSKYCLHLSMNKETYWRDKYRELLEKIVALQDKIFEERKAAQAKKKSKPPKGADKSRGK